MKLLRLAPVLLAAVAGCGPPSCPAGQTSQDTVITSTRCGGSVSAPASLSLPATIPEQCSLDPSSACLLVNQCLETSSPCARLCVNIDPLMLNLGLTGLPFAGPVTLPDPRVEVVMSGAAVMVTGGTVSVSQHGGTATVTFSVSFTAADGSAVAITSGTYTTSEHLGSQCGPV